MSGLGSWFQPGRMAAQVAQTDGVSEYAGRRMRDRRGDGRLHFAVAILRAFSCLVSSVVTSPVLTSGFQWKAGED